MEAKEEVDGVLGALWEAQDPLRLCDANGPLSKGKDSGGACECPHGRGNLDPGMRIRPRPQIQKEDRGKMM
jgi:hypothetical protein